MPTVTFLLNHLVAASKAVEVDERTGAVGESLEVWTLQFTDNGNGNQILVKFDRGTRDSLVRQLTGGVVLAGGEFPRAL